MAAPEAGGGPPLFPSHAGADTEAARRLKARLTLHILAAMAEHEREMISARTRAALAAAKARGVTLDNPKLRAGTPEQARAAAAARAAKADRQARDLAPVVAEVKAAGCRTLAGIAGALTARGVPPPSGRGPWHRSAVHRLLRRLEAVA
jgi:DNA invertase Pin-like site-specific DNA recombinase